MPGVAPCPTAVALARWARASCPTAVALVWPAEVEPASAPWPSAVVPVLLACALWPIAVPFVALAKAPWPIAVAFWKLAAAACPIAVAWLVTALARRVKLWLVVSTSQKKVSPRAPELSAPSASETAAPDSAIRTAASPRGEPRNKPLIPASPCVTGRCPACLTGSSNATQDWAGAIYPLVRSYPSAGAQILHGLVAAEEVEQKAQGLAARARQLGVAFEDQARIVMRNGHQFLVLREVSKAQRRKPALASAEHLAGAAQSQILFGDAETVLGFAEDREALPRHLAERRLVQQDAGRGLVAAADAAAQLMQLREPEALRVFDDHDRCRGDVDADLDDRRRDEQIDTGALGIGGGECGHRAVLLGAFHAAMHEPDPAG